MAEHNISEALDNIIEEPSSHEHERWSHWQRYMHSKGRLQADGSMVIPADLTSRWTTQMSTPYSHLSEDEKESDREQVRSYLEIIKDLITGQLQVSR